MQSKLQLKILEFIRVSILGTLDIIILDTSYTLFYSNLISLSKLDVSRYTFKFWNGCFNFSKNNHFINSSILHDDFYKWKLNNLFAKTLLTLHQCWRLVKNEFFKLRFY